MRSVRVRGFALVEALVALVLGGVAAAAAFRLLHGAQRAYRVQTARIQIDHEVRAAVAILAAELRPLDPRDPDGSDIVEMTPSSFTYRATRGIRFLCQAPDPSRGRVVLADAPAYGERNLSGTPRSVLLHAALDTAASPGGRWLRVTAAHSADGVACPGGRPGTAITLVDVSADELMRVENGAPIRTQSLVRIHSYQDGDGVYWLGWKETDDGGSWGSPQPFAGPVAAGGLELEYFDRNGSVANVPGAVAIVGITVTGRAPGNAVRLRLSTRVALRNGVGQ